MKISGILLNIRKIKISEVFLGLLLITYLAFFFYIGREQGYREIPTKILTPIMFVVAIIMGGLFSAFQKSHLPSLILFTIWALLTYFWSESKEFHFRQLQMLVGNIVIGVVLISFINKINAFLLIAVTISICSILLFIKGLEVSSVTFISAISDLDVDNTFKSFEENENSLASLYLLGITSIFYILNCIDGKVIKIIFYGGILTLIYGISLTASRSTLMGSLFLISLNFLGSHKYKFRLKVFFVAIVTFFLLTYFINFFVLTGAGEKFLQTGSSSSDYARSLTLTESLNMFSNNLFFGIGLGNVAFKSSLNLYAHNDLLEVAATTGIIGLILYALFLNSYYKIIRTVKIINFELFNCFRSVFYTYLFMGLLGVWFTDVFFYIILATQIGESIRLAKLFKGTKKLFHPYSQFVLK